MASLPLTTLDQNLSTTAVSTPSAMVGSAPESPARLSPLEWSIVAMAERDSMASIREAGRYTRALRSLFGVKPPNRLANDRLEALRRVAVFAWKYGWNVPKSELARFFESGFTSDQFELIQTSVGQARVSRSRRRGR